MNDQKTPVAGERSAPPAGSLLPCPFCGSDKITHGVVWGILRYWHYAQCEPCGAHGPRMSQPPHQDGATTAIKQADEAWNKRANNSISRATRPVADGDSASPAGASR